MMNILILGKNEINGALAEYLNGLGLQADTVPDAKQIKSISGEYGNFYVKAAGAEYKPAAIIITEPAEKDMPDTFGAAPSSIFDAEGMRKISESGTKTPVAVLLDYFSESPQYAAATALENAIMLAAKKYNVIFLSRFMRTAGLKSEELYKSARNAGVTFIKYEKIRISYDKEKAFYEIEATDGVNDVSLSVKYLAADSGYGTGEKFAYIAKKLRLKTNEAGFINEDRYYLGSALTGRKGVYYITRDNWRESAEYIVSAVSTDFGAFCENKDYAIIDGDKCAFCYTCYRACPHAAMEPDTEERVMVNSEEACDGCGTCASICPGNAVTLAYDNFAEVKLSGKSGKIKVFSCENSGDIAMKSILPELGELERLIEYETVACGGRIGFEQLSGALPYYGKVVALVCIDDACRHYDGNKRACLQAERLAGMLEKAGVDKNRAYCLKTSHARAGVVKDELKDIIMEGML